MMALQAGYNYGITTELFHERYHVAPASLPPGEYRQITGNQALSLGCIAASVQSGKPILYASYPITPASDILHELAQHKNFGVKTMQSEDEIAAVSACIGAAYGGYLGVTGTSGPGLDLKGEALGYAVMVELPMVVLNIQRGGPSTGLPTKTEQTDLLAAIHGRHGEAPIPVLAPSTPGDCFYVALEAFRIALKYMTPVILLSDGALANGAEPTMASPPNCFTNVIMLRRLHCLQENTARSQATKLFRWDVLQPRFSPVSRSFTHPIRLLRRRTSSMNWPSIRILVSKPCSPRMKSLPFLPV